MSAVTPREIKPGLVVRLDPELLRAEPGCVTNAELSGGEDRAVRDVHFFLVLHVDEVDGAALAVPLFSSATLGNVPLAETLKAGPAHGWVGTTSYFSRWQHWWIPPAHLRRASSVDDTFEGCRRSYAADQPAILMGIADWRKKNRAEWRTL